MNTCRAERDRAINGLIEKQINQIESVERLRLGCKRRAEFNEVVIRLKQSIELNELIYGPEIRHYEKCERRKARIKRLFGWMLLLALVLVALGIQVHGR